MKEKTNVEKNVNDDFFSMRVGRGGSWNPNARNVGVSYRNIHSPKYPIKNLGFRLVLQEKRKP